MKLEKVSIPDGVSGEWKVEKFTTDRSVWRYAADGRDVPVGETFTRLLRGRTVVMSDTPAEMLDHSEPVYRATGSCLINGLGLGMVLKAILKNPSVTDVTVVEMSSDVISLVAGQYTDPRVTIIHADAMTFKPPKGKRYNMVWHDIWDAICADNLCEMHYLHRKYGKRTDWQGSWARYECERQRDSWGREKKRLFNFPLTPADD